MGRGAFLKSPPREPLKQIRAIVPRGKETDRTQMSNE